MLRFIGFLGAAALLVSCGSGDANFPGDGDMSRATIIASVDTDRIATPSGETVTSVLSPYATAKIGERLITAVGPASAAPLLMGVDANGETKLLRYESSEGVLSADSTLYALVRLGLNTADLPADMDQSAPLAYVRQSTRYAPGLSSLRSALASAMPTPLQTQAVIDSIAEIVADSLNLAAAASAGPQKSQVKAVLVLPGVAVDALPYYFWDESNINKTWLVDEAGLFFKNRTFLAWNLGTVVGATTIGEVVALPLKQTTRQLFANYADSESSTPVLESKEKFSVTVGQTAKTHLINAELIVSKSTYAILEVALGGAKVSPTRIQKCTIKVSQAILTNETFASELVNFSAKGIVNFLWDKKIDLFKSVLDNCSKDGEDLDKAIENGITTLSSDKFFERLNIIYKSLKAARTAAAAYGTISQFMQYGNYSAAAELCRYDGKISPCVVRLAMDPIELGFDETADLTIRAYGENDTPIRTPSSLVVTSDDITIAQPSLLGYRIKGVAQGAARISIVDTVTGKHTVADVVVKANSGSHWAGSFRALYCTPISSDNGANQWYFEDPCQALGSVFGSTGYFYFDDISPKVILGSTPSNSPVRTIMNLGWKSTNDTFGFSIPLAYRIRGAFSTVDGLYGHEIVTSGTRVTTFSVLRREPNAISGTFEVNTVSAYPAITSLYIVENWRVVPTIARGTWSASRIDRPLPQTDMKGYDFCFSYNNMAIKQMTVDSLSNPYMLPGWAGTMVVDGCKYE